MNQTFDLNRWWLLVGKHWSENRKKYILSLIAITGLLLVWFFFVVAIDNYRPLKFEVQVATYFFGLILVGCLYSSLFFGDLASKSKGINYLTVPASHFEKMLCALFFATIAFLICYTAIFYMLDIVMVKVSNAIAYSNWQKNHEVGEIFEPDEVMNIFTAEQKGNNSHNIFHYLFLVYFTLQSAFILGSVYFPKFSFIKTVITLLLIALFFSFFMAKVIPAFMPEGNYYRALTSYNFYSGNNDPGKIVILPEWINTFLEFLIKFALAPIFWLATYFRLKEKEI